MTRIGASICVLFLLLEFAHAQQQPCYPGLPCSSSSTTSSQQWKAVTVKGDQRNPPFFVEYGNVPREGWQRGEPWTRGDCLSPSPGSEFDTSIPPQAAIQRCESGGGYAANCSYRFPRYDSSIMCLEVTCAGAPTWGCIARVVPIWAEKRRE
jgi:hypothetical protein